MKKRNSPIAKPFREQQKKRGDDDGGSVGNRHYRGGGAAPVKITTVGGTLSTVLNVIDLVIMSMTPMIVLALLLNSH